MNTLIPVASTEQRELTIKAMEAHALTVRDSARKYMAEQRLKHKRTLAVFQLARHWDLSHYTIPTEDLMRNDVQACELPKSWMPQGDFSQLVNELPTYRMKIEEHMRSGKAVKVVLPSCEPH